jgi:hypothetical protein
MILIYPDIKLTRILHETMRANLLSVTIINHYTYESVRDQIAAINKFSKITAEGWHKDGKLFRLRHLLFRPLFRFIRAYFLRLGFLDGLPGLIIASTTSYGVFIKYAKLWEYNRTTEISH